jgi:antitoxin VapB
MAVRTRIFRSGNSLAVRIPKDLAVAAESELVEIERQGDVLTIRPLNRRTLAGIGQQFAAFSPGFMAEGRESHEQSERDWGEPV